MIAYGWAVLLALLLLATPAELKDAFAPLAPAGIALTKVVEAKGELTLTGTGQTDVAIAELMRALRPLMRTDEGPAQVLERPSNEGLKLRLLVQQRPVDLPVTRTAPYDVKLLRATQQKGFIAFEIRLK